jgi:hypothetical protein
MNGQLWKRESLFAEAKDLPEDIIVYSAWDVEPLLDIYSIMTSIIEPDFVPLLNVCEFFYFNYTLNMFRYYHCKQFYFKKTTVLVTHIRITFALP